MGAAGAVATIDQTGHGSLAVRDHGTKLVVFNQEDRSSRAIFLRDSDNGEFWQIGVSPSADQPNRGRHGLGYTTIETSVGGIEVSWTIFTPGDQPVEIWQLTLNNPTNRKRRLGVFWVANWAKSNDPTGLQADYGQGTVTAYCRDLNGGQTNFLSLDKEPSSYDTDRTTFLGFPTDERSPAAVVSGKCSRSLANGSEAVGVLQKNITLGPKAALRYLAFAGALRGQASPKKIIDRIETYRRPGSAEAALEQMIERYQTNLRHHQLRTDEEVVNRYYNGFLGYQALVSKDWPEPTVTESLTDIPSLDRATRASLICDADHSIKLAEQALQLVFKDGRVISSWGNGEVLLSGAANANDSLKLASLVIDIVKETGQSTWLHRSLPYYDGGSGSILEHLTRLIEFGLEQCQDGLVMVAQYGLTALTMELVEALKELIALHDQQLHRHYGAQIERLSNSLNGRFWASPFYSRGTKNGERISPKKEPHGFDLATQLSAITSGVADADRTKKILQTISKNWPGLPPRLSPAYADLDPDNPGDSGAVPGRRRNGGVDSRLIAKLAQAMTLTGNGDGAWKYLQMLLAPTGSQAGASPNWQAEYVNYHGRSLRAEPLADGFGTAEIIGRVFRQNILGLQPTLGGLKINPCLPRSWRTIEVSRRFRGADYHIRILNPFRVSSGVDRIVVDGIRLTGNVIRPFTTGSHFVEVTLG